MNARLMEVVVNKGASILKEVSFVYAWMGISSLTEPAAEVSPLLVFITVVIVDDSMQAV